MGGALKAVGGAIGGVIKQVAPAVIKAIAPAATSLLSKITDGFVSKGADFLKTTLAKLPLPSPLKALADKLIGKGADMLKNLGGGLIEKGLTKLMDMVTGRNVDGQNVQVPGYSSDPRQTAIQNNPAVPNSANTGSSSSAATAGASTGASGSASNPNLPPNPKSFGDLADNNNMQALLAARDAYQNARQAMMDQAKYMSDLMKAAQETLKAIGQNVGR